jgi:hypothetical protein
MPLGAASIPERPAYSKPWPSSGPDVRSAAGTPPRLHRQNPHCKAVCVVFGRQASSSPPWPVTPEAAGSSPVAPVPRTSYGVASRGPRTSGLLTGDSSMLARRLRPTICSAYNALNQVPSGLAPRPSALNYRVLLPHSGRDVQNFQSAGGGGFESRRTVHRQFFGGTRSHRGHGSGLVRISTIEVDRHGCWGEPG